VVALGAQAAKLSAPCSRGLVYVLSDRLCSLDLFCDGTSRAQLGLLLVAVAVASALGVHR
jgi:hypothetical protein